MLLALLFALFLDFSAAQVIVTFGWEFSNATLQTTSSGSGFTANDEFLREPVHAQRAAGAAKRDDNHDRIWLGQLFD
jgi:hypothetical protein